MPARRINSTYRTPQSARQRVLAAQEELRTETEAQTQAAETEPMRRWPHPIPTRDTACCSACPCSSCCSCTDGETSAALTQALEKLQYQSQVLTDLLAAVNSLTAAVLCLKASDSDKD